MHVSSRDDFVAVKVIRAPSPLALTPESAHSCQDEWNAINNIHPYKHVTVHIPHLFHGPVMLKSVNRTCVLSDKLLRNSMDTGTIYHTKTFVGEFLSVSRMTKWESSMFVMAMTCGWSKIVCCVILAS